MSISPFSTTWPPVAPSSVPVLFPFTSTWPPQSNTANLLAPLASRAPAAMMAVRALAVRLPQAVPTLTQRVIVAPELASEAERLVDDSTQVVSHLVSAEVWRRFEWRITGARWQPGSDVPGFDLVFADDLGPLLNLTVPPVVYASLDDAVSKVALQPNRLDDILIEAARPELMLLWSLQALRDATLAGRVQDFRWTLLVTDVVIDTVVSLVHRLKHGIGVMRPSQTDANWSQALGATLLDLPPYLAYPGGHAAVCAALAEVLGALACGETGQTALRELAREIGLNREAAGLHTKFDTDVGITVGQAIGKTLLAAADRRTAADHPLYLSWAAAMAMARKEW